MEVLPCSGVQHIGESDSKQNSGKTPIYGEQPNGFEQVEQVEMADGGMVDLLLNAEEKQIETQSDHHRKLDELSIDEGLHSGASFSDFQAESQKLSCDSHDFEDDEVNVQDYSAEPSVVSESSHLNFETIESESNNYRNGEQSLSEPKWLEHDESVALWVKWRGKWQAGIRCSRADWPLSTLKAKPTHDRKKYFVIFFPHTRNYSWADTLLVLPINELPRPIAYKTHNIGQKMVKDLSVARRFIMKKLAVGMLNIIDQFHIKAFIETARNVMAWKEFALEASRCSGYSDLGRMLLKLQHMILPCYINSDWLQHSFQSWVQQCQAAESAESIELLRQELFDSILWNEVNALWDAPLQPILVSEWKTWKHEIIKWFSTSNPIRNGGDLEQQSSDSPSTMSLQVSRKRPKLEVRRAEPHASLVETDSPLQTMRVDDSDFFNNRDNLNVDNLVSEFSKEEDFREGAAPVESPCSVADRWDEIVVEPGSSELIQNKDIEMTPVNVAVAKKTLDPGIKNRQCSAFIESKGRQCVRWANDGDIYCCVHLASRFNGSSTKAETSPSVPGPMCEGTTVLGTRCKHRSLPGSSFCKKHRVRPDTQTTPNSTESSLKRKYQEITTNSETASCKDIVLTGEVESPLDIDPIAVMDREAFQEKDNINQKLGHSSHDYNIAEILHCIGSNSFVSGISCHESPKRYSLYCDKHIPSWLKRARNGKSRIIPKEIFIDLLKDCRSMEQKLHLHRACELFYKLFKSILSLRNPVPMEVQIQWALSEVSKDFCVGEFLLRLVRMEKERLKRLWGFSSDGGPQVSSSLIEESPGLPLITDGSHDDEKYFRCKICSKEFLSDEELSNHWMDNHKKEAQWHFQGHACAICLDSFTNKKGLETHVQERHHVQFVEQCMLLQCIPCRSHFGNNEQLWSHVLSSHSTEFRLSKSTEQLNKPVKEKEDSVKELELANAASMENNTESLGGIRKFVCRFCGLKFDLLPDLGRHHQAAHMGPNLFSSRLPKRGIRHYAYRLKSGRLSRPMLKKGLGAAAYRMRHSAGASMKKRIQASKSLNSGELTMQPDVSEIGNLGRLADSHCSSVAKILFTEIQKTKPRPNNQDILAIARSACCRVSLKASLEGRFGVLPERLYLKAAKLCSEHNIQVDWHREGFICSRGCKSFKDPGLLLPLMPPAISSIGKKVEHSSDQLNDWEVDECHCIIDLHHFREGPKQKTTVLCTDISLGKETIPVVCVVDEYLLDSVHALPDGSDGCTTQFTMPWESFTYVTKPLFDQSYNPLVEGLQLGCACSYTICSPEICDHVYLFDNDYEDAKDIYGKPMIGRFPYDDKGRIILEEGYLVYECNSMCSCSRTCLNRVLQNGIRVKLEVFKTENKGWAVRAGEPILRGTFVCEYIGEVLDEQEAEKRRERYGLEGCSYMYNIDAHTNDMSRLMEGQARLVIDATNYGNVSRFINHSCSPNLVNHQVLVDSMDSRRSHIGLYASQDIASGEELTYNYRYELLPGEGYPCHCGASMCRGRLY